ncbi:MAG TPA: hypothetical protein VFX59_04465 [Polyangiales bacterium]|nr:hypothetical protein [Polyangiales bacterium]
MRRWRGIPWALLATCTLACREQPAQGAVPKRVELPVVTVEAPTTGLPMPMVRNDAFRRGLVLGPLVAPEDEDEWKKQQRALLDRAAVRGVTDLQLIVEWMQTSVSAVEIAPFESVHDTLLTWLIEQAKQRKLRVLLTPRVAVENEASWAVRGLKPSSWERWWWSYQRIALHYAKVAATRKVTMLAIGSELSSTEGQLDRWRKLIKAVRKIYKGKLTYLAAAENFDKVPFWDALDVVSIAVDQAEPRSEAQSVELLSPLPKRIARVNRAYLISEASCGEGEHDDARELLCQRALYRNFSEEPKLQGVFVSPGPESKTAGDVASHWFVNSKS